ncbi:MAG TPA: GAF domain-containing sensor histidine kinase [Candidatus Limnocylindria bacterium]
MSTPQLPLPPLIAALRGVGRDGSGDQRAIAIALGGLASQLGLAGIRLALDKADPLPSLTVGWGTLAARAEGNGGALGGDTSTRLWIDGERAVADRAAVAVEAAVAAARAHLRADRAESHLSALDAAVRGIAGVLSTERVLQLIVDRVRELAGARYAALGLVGDDGRIEAFLTSGISAELRGRIGQLPHGRGLLGLLIAEGQSIRIPDLAIDPRRYGFPPHHPEMHSFLGVPIQVRGRSVGNLYLTDKIGEPEFSADDQRLVERFAMHAGIAFENARLHEQVQRLVVVEERERIGRDLHDGIIQRIYGVNLSLDEVPELVQRDPGEAARRVDEAIDSLNTAIAEIREFIYILRPPPSAEGALVAALQALAAEVRMHASLNVDVLTDDVPRLPGETTSQLVSIAREALSNAVRHASATRVDISVEPRDGRLEMAVSDDGSGFDPSAPLAEQHHGIGNMRKRAEQLGGTLRIMSRAGFGTRIIVTVPLHRDSA